MKPITLTPPNASLFAGVQIDVPDEAGRDGRRIVGAAPAFRMELRPTGRTVQVDGELVAETEPVMVPLERVRVDCHLQPSDTELRAVWAYEDSSLPNEQTGVSLEAGPERLVGGLRVT